MAVPRLLRYSSEAVCHALHAMSQSFVQRFSDGNSNPDTVEEVLATEHDVLLHVALLLRCLQMCGCSAAATLQCTALLYMCSRPRHCKQTQIQAV